MTLLRRKFLHLFAGAAAMPLARFAQAQVSPTTSQSVRVATGLLATWQSTAWLGAEAGVRYAKLEDQKAAEDLYAFHVPVFQKVPRPSFPGMQALREFLVAKYPTAMSLKESDIADSSFIDELERSGFIDRLYAADTK